MTYELDDRADRIDIKVVTQFLINDAYWSRWRTSEDIELQVRAAWRVVGCYVAESGEQVGFARAMSDGVALAYLADVFVVPEHRGRGLGRALVREMIDAGPGAGFRWLLHTADAHGLYADFGFAPPDNTLLERPHASARSAFGTQ